MSVEIPFDSDAEVGGGPLHEAPNVAGEKMPELFQLEGGAKTGELRLHIAAGLQQPFARFDSSAHLLRRERALELIEGALFAFHEGPHDDVSQRLAFELEADHIEHLVGAELLPDLLQLIEKCGEHPTLSRLLGDEVYDHYRVVL